MHKKKYLEDFWLNYLKELSYICFPFKMERESRSKLPTSVKSKLDNKNKLKLEKATHGSKDSQILLLACAANLVKYFYTKQIELIITTASYGSEDTDSAPFFLRVAIDPKLQLIEYILAVKKEYERNYSKYCKEIINIINSKYEYLKLGDPRELYHLVVIHEDAILKTDWHHLFELVIILKNNYDIEIIYNKINYSEYYMHQFLEQIKHILSMMLFGSKKNLVKINYLTNEQSIELAIFNKREFSLPYDGTILGLFDKAVALYPNSVAVNYKHEKITYKELDILSNRLANYIKLKFHLNPDDLVAVITYRSSDLIIALIGILKSGAAFLPIAPDFPQSRIELLIEDSKCKAVLYDINVRPSSKKIGVPIRNCINGTMQSAKLNTLHQMKNLAYVIYTSGSTGKPKGVMIEHGALSNKVQTLHHEFGFDSSFRCLLVAAVNADPLIEQILLPLTIGASIYIPENSILGSANNFWSYIHVNQISYINCVPTLLESILDEKCSLIKKVSLKYLVLGGDIFTLDLYRKIKLNIEVKSIINLYGPTETTIDATIYNCRDDEIAEFSCVPIGKPCLNYQIYILDDRMQPVPIGIPGEIYIGGYGLARGYLNQVKFSISIFDKTEIYRTFDTGMWLPNGNIKFLRRCDRQIKIRGYRVELEEIETAIQYILGINKVVVLYIDKSQSYLAAFINISRSINTKKLNEELKRLLPDYMIPAFYITLDSFPYTINGKLDYQALMEKANLLKNTSSTLPENDIEEKLVNIWKDVLALDNVGVKDNFFHLGGQSLKAIQLSTRISHQLGLELPLEIIFQTPTIRAIAGFLISSKKSLDLKIQRLTNKAYYEISYNQSSIWFVDSLVESSEPIYNVPILISLTGKVKTNILSRSLEEVLFRHETLRASVLMRGGKLCVKINAMTSFKIEDINLANAESATIDKHIYNFSKYRFNLPDGEALFKSQLIKCSEQHYILAIITHHIICDGWSTQIFYKDLMYYYALLSEWSIDSISLLDIQYKDYAIWEKKFLETEAGINAKYYWLECFKNSPAELKLPYDYEETENKSCKGASVDCELISINDVRLIDYCSNNNITISVFIISIINILLFILSRQTDLVVGIILAGRSNLNLENQIGPYAKCLPLRSSISIDSPVEGFMNAVKMTLLQIYKYEIYPLALITKTLSEMGVVSSAHSLFKLIINDTLNFEDVLEINCGDIKTRFMQPDYDVVHYDLIFNYYKINGKIGLRIDYKVDLFLSSTIFRIKNKLVKITNEILSGKHCSINELATKIWHHASCDDASGV